MELCGMECIDLTKNSVKILGLHFSYKRIVNKIENVLKIWRTRNLTVKGKTTIFKTLAISKVIHLPLVTNVPQVITDQLNKIQKDFIWNRKHPKMLQCSWIKRLYDTATHCWKIISAFLIRKKLGRNFFFHSNLSINPNKIKKFPTYYQDILIKWEKHFSFLQFLPSPVASQCLCHNKYIKIDDKTIFSSSLSAKGINLAGQLFQNN